MDSKTTNKLNRLQTNYCKLSRQNMSVEELLEYSKVHIEELEEEIFAVNRSINKINDYLLTCDCEAIEEEIAQIDREISELNDYVHELDRSLQENVDKLSTEIATTKEDLLAEIEELKNIPKIQLDIGGVTLIGYKKMVIFESVLDYTGTGMEECIEVLTESNFVDENNGAVIATMEVYKNYSSIDFYTVVQFTNLSEKVNLDKICMVGVHGRECITDASPIDVSDFTGVVDTHISLFPNYARVVTQSRDVGGELIKRIIILRDPVAV